MSRSPFICFVAAVLVSGATGRAVAGGSTSQDPAAAWEFSASAYYYIPTCDDDYLQPTVTGDRGAWHAELRYNYEDMETGSAWAGYTFDGGSEVVFSLTPMVGGVFGRSVGFAPGFHASITWRALMLYSEGEHFLDAANDYDSFFYSWSEITLCPWEIITLGAAAQKTQVYESPREVQWGILLGVGTDRLGGTIYVFDPDQSEPTYVIAVHAGM